MWEPGGSSSNSSNRGVVVLVTTLGLCILLYKAWGPLLLITCALVLVVHTCYSLLVNDSLFAPYTLVLLRYARNFALELALTLKLLVLSAFHKSSKALQYLRRRYEEGNRRRYNDFVLATPATPDDDMNGRQRNAYRLSTSGIEFEHGSPLNHDPYHSFALNGAGDNARTSTPIPRGSTWKKAAHPNGDLGQFIPLCTFSPKKPSSMRSENKHPVIPMPYYEETLYSPKGSPWGNSISPKMRDRNPGIKTVQTVAGPLLTSTRYNIDPKIYTDVSSPGLTTRLIKYASEANNKLMHLAQYAPGQFPKVNLHASPTPLLSPKIARARVPVTVRVAPPEIVNYSPILDSHPHQERHKLFSKNSPSEHKESTTCSPIDPVLKKISLKRHASGEDMLELAKKQRAEKMYYGQLENLEEMMQKRARDESMTSEDDLSPQSKTQRPTKRSKASSCHDILHSLSSSLNVFTGVKRKANDTSHSNTPDTEKHFKPSTKSPSRSPPGATHPEKETTNSKEQLNVKVPVTNSPREPHQHKNREKLSDMPKTKRTSLESQKINLSNDLNQLTPKVPSKVSPATSRDSKLIDKLFMRPEPQTNEKLKTLIEEQGSVEGKFTTNDKEEIKKQDIVNMRQNSMRLRLQSMFDAISGKSANKIDPDVVIQAEEVNPPTSSTCTSLTALTSTTMVNTSPISTNIVPILKSDTDFKSATTKHVTFDLPVSTSSTTSAIATISSPDKTTIINPPEPKPIANEISFGKPSSSAPPVTFNFGSVAAPNPAVSSDSAKSSTTSGLIFPKTSIEQFNNTLSNTAPSNASSISNNNSSNITSSSIVSTSSSVQPSTMSVNVSSSPAVSNPISDAPKNSSFTMSSGFTFGSVAKTVATSAPVISFQSDAPITAKSTELQTSATTNTIISANSSITPSFGSTLMKSPASTLIGQSTIALPTSSSDKQDSGTGGFNFNTTITSTNNSSISLGQPAPSFNTSLPSSLFSSTPLTTTSAVAPTFSFGAATKGPATGGFSFGAVASSTATPTVNTSFGIAGQTSSTNTGAPTTFSTPATSMGSHAISASSAVPAFGNLSTPLFGTSNSPSLFSGSSNTSASTIFKSSSTTTSATTPTIFGSPSSIPTFGSSTPGSLTSSSTPTLTTATTTTPSLFGNIAAAKPTTTSTIPSLFGNLTPTTTATAAVAPRPAFGESTLVQQQTQPNSIFSGMSGTPSGSTSIFGSSVAGSTSGTPTGLFNTSNNAPQSTTSLGGAISNPADNTSIFGQSKSPPAMSFGATSSTFGQVKPAPSFGQAKPTPSFGQGKPAPSFGLSNTSGSSTSSGFQIGSSGSTMPSFNTGSGTQLSSAPSTSIFGSTFGSSPPANSNTNSNTSNTGFGVPGNTATSTFGTAAPSFGSSGPSATTSPFGSSSSTNQIPSLFGNVATPNAASFTFGATQPQQQQSPPQQPSASFSFGGSNNSSTTSTGGLFQFGASNTSKPAGFNFNAPTATPSINFTGGSTAPASFNAGMPQGAPQGFSSPTTNMFSIGSSSSTPRSRTSRQRRQR